MAKKAKKKPEAQKKQTRQITVKNKDRKPKKQIKIKETKEKKVKKEKIIEPQITLHSHVKDYIKLYKEGIDPEKAKKLKNSLHTILTKGGPAMLAVAALTAMLLLIDLYTDNRVLANTKIGGVELGYMKIKDAKNKILVEMDQYIKAPIEFSYQDQKYSFTPEELGIQFSPTQTFLSIPTASFQENTPLIHILSQLTSRSVPIKYTIDENKAINLLEKKFELKESRAKNARFILVENEYQILPEEEGIKIDSDKLLNELENNFNTLSSTSITIATEREYPRIKKERLAEEKERLLALLQKPIFLYSGDKSTTLNLAHNLSAVKFAEKTKFILPEENIEMPIILKDQGSGSKEEESTIKSNIEIELDEENTIYLLDEAILKDIEIPTSGVSIYRAEDGSIKIEGEGEDGKSVPKTKLLKSITLAVNNGIGEVEIPVRTETAPLTVSKDLQELGIKELIATGHSAYYGSPPNRMYNINLGTSRYDGLLIKPGEEFSFNKHLGNVDASSGYLPEKVIKKNKVEVEYGGGICQVSTTIYRAALLAGLPITERNPHSWKVSYYGQSMGHGLDATVYPGSSDVKFINDTPGHIIVHSYTKGSEAYFKFYGTKDSRQIEMVGPIGGGLHYKWYRYITKNGEKIEEKIISDYKPVPPPEPPPPVIAQKPEDGF
jgi:vancomycin resistance protein YoaR